MDDLESTTNCTDSGEGLEDLMCDLRSGGVDVPATMTYEDFTHVDDNVVLCSELTDDELVCQVVP